MGDAVLSALSGGDYAIPLGALILSAATLVFVALGTRRKADEGWVSQLETRVKECEEDRGRLNLRVKDLEEYNDRLQGRLRKLENGPAR